MKIEAKRVYPENKGDHDSGTVMVRISASKGRTDESSRAVIEKARSLIKERGSVLSLEYFEQALKRDSSGGR